MALLLPGEYFVEVETTNSNEASQLYNLTIEAEQQKFAMPPIVPPAVTLTRLL